MKVRCVVGFASAKLAPFEGDVFETDADVSEYISLGWLVEVKSVKKAAAKRSVKKVETAALAPVETATEF